MLQRIYQTLMYILETTIAHDDDLISMVGCVQQEIDNLLRIFFDLHYCSR